MTEPMDGQLPSDEAVKCPSCGGTYGAESVAFCDCLSSTPSPSCPRCGKCLCKLSAQEQQAFWMAAPPVLYRRKVEGRKAESTAANPNADLRRPLVLVAEDDVVTRRVAQRVVEKLGYGVVTAQRGDEALELARLHKPDAVLTDALMPKMDGRKLCLALKQDPDTAHIRVIVMTGLFTKGMSKSQALTEFRADAFLKKPVDSKDLEQALTDLIGPPANRAKGLS